MQVLNRFVNSHPTFSVVVLTAFCCRDNAIDVLIWRRTSLWSWIMYLNRSRISIKPWIFGAFAGTFFITNEILVPLDAALLRKVETGVFKMLTLTGMIDIKMNWWIFWSAYANLNTKHSELVVNLLIMSVDCLNLGIVSSIQASCNFRFICIKLVRMSDWNHWPFSCRVNDLIGFRKHRKVKS